ncbi:MAG: hypothetical protein CM15mP120_27690 [Pseudomonadota bacterium]|nr:MAG: hypothetical protein CM15mP120_27690 [Pseudomonadota bacterium]
MTLILDYEAGNLASVRRACARGLQAQYCADPDQLLQAERIIFPGVGAAGVLCAVSNSADLTRRCVK